MDLFSNIFESFCERSDNHSVLVLVLPSSCNDSYYRLAFGILENIPCPSLAHNNQVQDVADDEGRRQMEQGTQNDILFLVLLVLFYGS